MHEHNECDHELKYCPKCDAVYCEKCKKEWFPYKLTFTNSTYPPYNGVSASCSIDFGSCTTEHGLIESKEEDKD